MKSIWPALFIGLHGSDFRAVDRLKEYLLDIKIRQDDPLLLNNEDLDPYQFIVVSVNLQKDSDPLFICGKDTFTLPQLLGEISRKLDLVTNSTVRAKEITARVGIDVVTPDIFPPQIYIVPAPSLTAKPDCAWLVILIQGIRDLVTSKFTSVVMYAEKDGHYQDLTAKVAGICERLYLYGRQSDLVLNSSIDAEEQAFNLLSCFAQTDAGKLGFKVNVPDMNGKIHSFGCAAITYSTQKLSYATATRILTGSEFINSFEGRLRDYLPDDDTRFVLEMAELDAMKEETGISAERYFPVIQSESENLSMELSTISIGEIEDQLAHIETALERDVFEKRTKDLLDSAYLFKQPLGKWSEYLDFLDFLLRYEIINTVKERTMALQKGMLDNWRQSLANTVERMKASCDPSVSQGIRHSGETFIAYSEKVISMIKAKFVQPAFSVPKEIAPPDRAPIDTAVKLLPYLKAILFRVFVFVMIALLPGYELGKWAGLGKIPALTVAIVFCAAVSMTYLWFGYYRKLLDLRDIATQYLLGKEDSVRRNLSIFEDKLRAEHLQAIVVDIQSLLLPHYGFFREYNAGRLLSKVTQKELENYFFNRRIIAGFLKETARIKFIAPYVSPLLRTEPVMSTEDIENQSRWVKENMNWDCIFKNDVFSRMNASDLMWKSIVGDKDSIEALLNVIILSLEAEIGRVIHDQEGLDNLMDFYQKRNKVITGAELFNIKSTSQPTFKIKYGEVAKMEAYIWNEDRNVISDMGIALNGLLDKNRIVFLQMNGPYEFSDIEWRGECQ